MEMVYGEFVAIHKAIARYESRRLLDITVAIKNSRLSKKDFMKLVDQTYGK